MENAQFSQTQIANFATLAGLLVIVLGKFGIVFGADELTFILGAVWSLGWTVYNYYQRFKKGDLNLGGTRK